MTDIVERLQREADLMCSCHGLLYDAAEEIKHLRKLNERAAKVITQCHSALSVLALGPHSSHIAQRALRNIEEGLTE